MVLVPSRWHIRVVLFGIVWDRVRCFLDYRLAHHSNWESFVSPTRAAKFHFICQALGKYSMKFGHKTVCFYRKYVSLFHYFWQFAFEQSEEVQQHQKLSLINVSISQCWAPIKNVNINPSLCPIFLFFFVKSTFPRLGNGENMSVTLTLTATLEWPTIDGQQVDQANSQAIGNWKSKHMPTQSQLADRLTSSS